jgi:hypothetical protein
LLFTAGVRRLKKEEKKKRNGGRRALDTIKAIV